MYDKDTPHPTPMATDALLYSELRYRRLFEAARDGILIVDPETRKIIDVNPFMIELLGYRFEEFIGKELYEIGLLKDEAASQVAFRELQQAGYIRYEDLPLETVDGRRVNVEFVSNIYKEGDTQIIQCNIRDISARKRSEAALRQSEERFKLVSRTVTDVLWDWNLVTNEIWWSDGFSSTFGYATTETEPRIISWESRLHPEEARGVIDSVQKAIASGAKSWSAEYRFRCKNGHYAMVQDNGYIIRDAEGKSVRMVGGMRDVTQQKKNEAQSMRAQRMESIGTLSGGIAHDLNNVLTPIMMSIELLKSEKCMDPAHATILETISVSCHRGADLIRQVLSFARGIEGQRIAIQIPRLIKDLQGIITTIFPSNITIVTVLSADLWSLAGDPSQLHQVLLNLAVNARDAMPTGGTLTLVGSNVILDAPKPELGQKAKAGKYVLIKISDTGCGIPLEIRDRILEPFFTTKELGKGTGLGLATVATIIKSHEGFMSFESEIGQGTTFKIYLPANANLRIAGSTPPLHDTHLPRGHNELVLVVDDESSIREITQRTLEAFGYRVLTANDGTEAVALYAEQRQQIALVLTDMMMPIMDGAATIEVLQRMNPAIKIIVVSGLQMTEEIARSGIRDFLPKPYTAQTLLQLVHQVIDRPASARAL